MKYLDAPVLFLCETMVMPKDLLGGFNVFLPQTTRNFMVTTKK
jgi:hypothetical protein